MGDQWHEERRSRSNPGGACCPRNVCATVKLRRRVPLERA
jgi:hypothetical protein